MKVKIIGAGSIGNHLAQASRRMGWDVVIVDNDQMALERMRNDIYPKRYGAWDEAIQLYASGSEPKGGFDIIIIGTPPDSHMRLALNVLSEKPRLLHIEKPLCTPLLDLVDDFTKAMKAQSETIVTVGYDHVVAESIEWMSDFLRQKPIGDVLTMDVEFRVHWRGIFAAHPWLSGPEDTYLGYWKRGGGAGCEHSHALHLWLHFSNILNWGNVKEVKTMLDLKKDGAAEYDQLAAFLLKTESGHIGRVIQDVVSWPPRKWARIQGSGGFVEWHCDGVPEGDLVKYQINNENIAEKVFVKKRPDDFYREVLHYQKLLNKEIEPEKSPLYFTPGLEAMRILNKVYLLE